MTDLTNDANRSDRDLDAALRERVIDRARTLSTEIINRLTVASDDLAGGGNHLAALGGIDGIERDINTLRSFLLLVS